MKVLVMGLLMLSVSFANTKFGVYSLPISGSGGGLPGNLGLMLSFDDTMDLQFSLTSMGEDYTMAGAKSMTGIDLGFTLYAAEHKGLDIGPVFWYSSATSDGDTASDILLGAAAKTMLNSWLGLKADGYFLHAKSGKVAGADYKGTAIMPGVMRLAFFLMF